MIDKKYSLDYLALIIFVLYMLTVSLYISIFDSFVIQVLILVFSLFLFILNKTMKNIKYSKKRIDKFWILSILAILGSLHSSNFIIADIAPALIFVLIIIIYFYLREYKKGLMIILKIIRWAGVFYALSVFLSFFYPNLYNLFFLRFLRYVTISRIELLISNGYYTGFTSDPAYVAGYLVFGIGALYCSWRYYQRKHAIVSLLLMFIALLLTQKRAHVVFLLISLMFIYLMFNKQDYVKIIKYVKMISLITAVAMLLFFIGINTKTGQVLFYRFIGTIDNFRLGEDISSGRISLYLHAWDLFIDSPLYGIGWGNYEKTVIGALGVKTEMKTHNIYLQILSETGIIGFLGIFTPILITFISTIKTVKNAMKELIVLNQEQFVLLKFSFFIQIFFLLYGLTGNLLTDFIFLTIYFISISIYYSLLNNRYYN